MKKIIILLAFLLIPSTFAIDCNILNQSFCNILDGLEENQELVFEALTYQEFADFDTVIKHNQNLEITEPLTTPKSSGYVKDAWIGIISLEPTVHTENAILSPGQGELLFVYGYQGNRPSGTMQGDCKTEYGGLSMNHQITILQNGKEITNINFDEDITIITRMKVTATIHITHYTWQPIRGRMRCAYDYKESRSSSLTIEDSIDITYYNPQTSYQLEYTNEVRNTTHGNFTVDNETAYTIEFDESNVSKRDWFYLYHQTQHGIIEVHTKEFSSTDIHNINLNENNFAIPSSDSCQITLFTHFRQETYNCDQDKNFQQITLTTNKQFYQEGETIYVTVEPAGETYQLRYGNNLQYSETGAEFTASGSGLIIAQIGERQVSQMIHVKSQRWHEMYSLSLVAGFLFLTSKVAMVAWRKVGL